MNNLKAEKLEWDLRILQEKCTISPGIHISYG